MTERHPIKNVRLFVGDEEIDLDNIMRGPQLELPENIEIACDCAPTPWGKIMWPLLFGRPYDIEE